MAAGRKLEVACLVLLYVAALLLTQARARRAPPTPSPRATVTRPLLTTPRALDLRRARARSRVLGARHRAALRVLVARGGDARLGLDGWDSAARSAPAAAASRRRRRGPRRRRVVALRRDRRRRRRLQHAPHAATWRACNTGRFVCCALAWALAVHGLAPRARRRRARQRAPSGARAPGRERARARARRLASADVDDLRTRAELDALLDAQKDALNRTQRVVDDWNARGWRRARRAPPSHARPKTPRPSRM